MTSKSITVTLASCLLLFVLCIPLAAQSTDATLSGVVEDPQGAIVPGVKITITNPATGLERTVATGSDGSFVVPLLPPASYTIEAAAPGFKRLQYPNVILNVNDRRSIRIRLEVGDVTGVVEVRPDDSLVDTSPAVGTTIDRTFVQNLPLNGRTFQSLILLTPGVTFTGGRGEFSVNGNRTNTNYFTVDGVAANIGVLPGRMNTGGELNGSYPASSISGITTGLVSVDALEEFKIQTSTYSAEFGRQPGGQVQIVTRSGGNEFHGTVFEYLRNEALDANDWFRNRTPLTPQQIAQGITKQPRLPSRQNQFGGTFSGPILLPRFGDGGPSWWSGKNKTFFFFSHESQRLRIPTSQVVRVPSLRLRQVAASSVQPFLNAFPLPDGPELIGTSGPQLGQPLGVAPLTLAYARPTTSDATAIRVDHIVSDKFRLFGRFNYAPSDLQGRNQSFITENRIDTTTLTLGATMILGKEFTNEVRFNHSRNDGVEALRMDDFGGAIPANVEPLIGNYAGAANRRGSISFSLPGAGGSFGFSLGDSISSYQRQFNLVDNLSVIKGPHRLKFGFDYRRLTPIFLPREFEVQNSFNSEDGIRTGVMSFVFISASQGARPIYNNFSAYLQDTWQASRRLTLDFGVRWEVNPPPGEANGIRSVMVQEVSSIDDIPNATLAPAGTA